MSAGARLTGNDLFPRFSDDEYARRFRAVRDAVVKDNLDAILVWKRAARLENSGAA